MTGRMLIALALTLGLGLAAVAPSRAQDAPRQEQAATLPAAVTTSRDVEIAGRKLRYQATAGALPVRDRGGRLLGEIAFLAYVAERPDGAGPPERPVTFAFNGGPGAASAYLNLAAIGPRRVAIGNRGDGPSTPPVLVDNAETWLDFTDLVFLDPAGTGFSPLAAGDDARNALWSVDGDARSLSRVIADWLDRNGRRGSPVSLVGESYGGFRAPKVAAELQASDGVGVSSLVLISPVLDFSFQRDSRSSPLRYAALLPSLAAVAMESDGAIAPQRLAEAERYAGGDYLADLLKGPRDEAAQRRIVERVAALTGLDAATVARFGGRLDAASFLRETGRSSGSVGSAYDGSVPAFDPDPFAARGQAPDAVLDAMQAPLTSAMLRHYDELGWRPPGRYVLLNEEANRRWNYGSGRGDRESLSELRRLLALDPRLRVVVAHGFTDLVTPYFESRLLLNQLPTFGDASRVRLALYPGGHMFYSRDASRAAMRDDARAVIAR